MKLTEYMAELPITVEVVFAETDRLIRLAVSLPAGSTVEQAIAMSAIEQKLAPASVDPERVGMHGIRVAPDHRLEDDDRVEIYRSLALDPMQARRRRARR